MDFFGGRDPSLFGLTRLLFGLLMVLDCFVERGLQHADSKWNDDGCKFPLFNFLEQLDPNVMILLQFIQGIGALCICVGYKVNKTGKNLYKIDLKPPENQTALCRNLHLSGF